VSAEDDLHHGWEEEAHHIGPVPVETGSVLPFALASGLRKIKVLQFWEPDNRMEAKEFFAIWCQNATTSEITALRKLKIPSSLSEQDCCQSPKFQAWIERRRPLYALGVRGHHA
jgi:hypothetical protein